VGAIPLAVHAAKEGVKVRILVPYNEEVEDILNLRVEEELGGRPIYDPDIDFRYTEQTSGTMATILERMPMLFCQDTYQNRNRPRGVLDISYRKATPCLSLRSHSHQ
jgi:hypothetical protein